MKKIILLLSTLLLSLISCNIEDKIEHIINGNIPNVEQEVSESFIIEASQLSEPGEIFKEVIIDITEIRGEIEESSDRVASLNDIILDDLNIRLTENSEQNNFDFLDSIVLTFISNSSDLENIFFDFGDIQKGSTLLTLPEEVNTSILSIIEESDENELTINLNIVTNTPIENDLEIVLNSTLLADLRVTF